MPSNVVTVSAVVFTDHAGRILGCRKRGTSLFQFPGGKPEPGESAADAACREVAEELGVSIAPGDLKFLGVFRAPAANEPGFTVVGHLFAYDGLISPSPRAEIEEIAWVDHRDPHVPLAPLSAQFVPPQPR